MNHKNNKHFQETDQKIKGALLTLLNEKKVPTISEICRRCRINRTTFYLHYEDIRALLDTLKNEIFQSFTDSYQGNPDVTLMSYISYLYFARHVLAYKDFYRFYFSVNTTFPLKDGFEEMWESIIKPYFYSIQIWDEKIMHLRFVCFQAGFTNTLSKWVENDCNLSCEAVANILTQCITL